MAATNGANGSWWMRLLGWLQRLDRRWIFLLMFLAVAVPVLVQWKLPEVATPLVRQTFDAVDRLPPGSRVLLAFDFDPASEGELTPMATAFTRHCCERRHKMYFMSLWPVGPQMIEDAMNRVIRSDFPELIYGEDYVNLGFMSGGEGVIKVMLTDMKKLFTTDAQGTSIHNIPMCADVQTLRDFDLIINISAGYPGTKEWVQYAATPYPDDIKVIAGCTGVQAPLLYPYIPEQLPGLLGAIKGASEYESLVLAKYGRGDEAKYQEGMRRMGPQLVAHVLMIVLIVVGNIVFFATGRHGTPPGGTPPADSSAAARTWVLVLLVILALFLVYRAAGKGAGRAFVSQSWQQDDLSTWQPARAASAWDAAAGAAQISWPRTIGVWVAALFTLCILSFLYRDNPLYKFAEAVVVGVSAAYWMVVGFWTVLVRNLFGKLVPEVIKLWAYPDLSPVRDDDWLFYFIPLVLGILLLWRLAPRAAWVARWPLAFIVGATAGFRLVAFIQADFLSQIRTSIQPLVVAGEDALARSLENGLLTFGVLCCLVYFFFSVEHKGVVGGAARVGIWFLMITFGAAFGYTVMGRIALLAIRVEFLFNDWLWLIDPTGTRPPTWSGWW